jgi:hypothetical protein
VKAEESLQLIFLQLYLFVTLFFLPNMNMLIAHLHCLECFSLIKFLQNIMFFCWSLKRIWSERKSVMHHNWSFPVTAFTNRLQTGRHCDGSCPYMSKLLTTRKSKSEKLYISLYIYLFVQTVFFSLYIYLFIGTCVFWQCFNKIYFQICFFRPFLTSVIYLPKNV